MITGFNTDVEHDGIVYHVQTEDKGLNSPLILSLVYSGGAILASKRTPYEDLIASGFDEAVLSERLKRQHKLICAAIRAGRVDDLKQMTARDAVRVEKPPVIEAATEAPPEPPVAAIGETPSAPIEETAADALPASTLPEFEIVANAEEQSTDQGPEPIVADEAEDKSIPTTIPPTRPVREPRPPKAKPLERKPYVVFDSRRESEEKARQGLNVGLLTEQEFRSGDKLNLGVLVTHRSGRKQKPLSGVSVSVKILGTTFRPIIVTRKTESDGVAVVKTEIPRFATGRAAILVRAVDGADAVEIRRVVHPDGK